MSEARARVLVALTIAGVVALALGPEILAGRFWAPADGLYQNFPHRAIAAAALWAGELPFWNPFGFGGMPLFATIQPGTLFPGNWTFLVLPPVAAQNAGIALAIALAATTTYMFVRALGLPRVPSLFAGLVFALGGFVTRHLEHVQMVQIAALTPLLLWAVERFAQTRRARHALAASLCVAGMVLAGSPQLTAYGLILATAYALFRAAALPAGERLGYLGHGLVAGACGVALAAVQLLPTLDFLGQTQRASFGPYAFAFRSLTPEGLPGLFAPYVFGARGPAWPFTTPFWCPDDWEGFTDGYAGVAALLLALVALGRFRVERQIRFWAITAVVGLVLALGRFTPAAELVAQLPVLNAMRYAHRHLFEFTLAVAVLAAYGLAWLQAREPGDAETRRRALLAGGGLIVGAGVALLLGAAVLGARYAARAQPYMPPGIDLFAGLAPTAAAIWSPLVLGAVAAALAAMVMRGGRPAWALALTTWLTLDLLLFGRLQGWVHRLPEAPASPLAVRWPDREAGREVTVPAHRYPDCRGCDVFAHLLALRYPGASTFQGLATVNGYDAFVPTRLGRLLGMDSVGHLGELDQMVFSPAHHALDMLGCRTVRLEPAVAARAEWRARLAGGRWRRLPDADGLVVLANPRALPSAWRVARALTLPAEEVDRRIGGHGAFDPRREALLDAPAAAPEGLTPGSARSGWLGPNRLALESDGPGPGLVVVSEGFEPGWSARLVAGAGAPRELPVLRADGVLMAVELPAGPCRVELAYRPRRWPVGLLVSILAALALAAWGARLRYARSHASGVTANVSPDEHVG